MLLSFRATNHKSLRDEQRLLLTPSDQEGDELPPPDEVRALPVVGIFGPNASGKSNVLDALLHMQRLVSGRARRHSDPDDGIPRYPFQLDPDSPEEPSSFVVDLLLQAERYTYGFTVDDETVHREWLYRYLAGGREEVVFERNRAGIKFDSESSFSAAEGALEPSADFLFLTLYSTLKSSNLDSQDHDSIGRVSAWFRRTVSARMQNTRFFRPRLFPRLGSVDRYTDRLSRLLAAADTGISRLSIERYSLEIDDDQRQYARWVFHQSGGDADFEMDIEEQSHGTRALMELGLQAIDVLDSGAVMVVDELDASLHSVLSARLIELFRDPDANPMNAQLIFTSHDPALLGTLRGREVLDKDEIWFTEKGNDGATYLYPFSGYGDDDESTRARRYLAGRYGAVPFLDDDLFVAALATRERDDTDNAPPHPPPNKR